MKSLFKGVDIPSIDRLVAVCAIRPHVLIAALVGRKSIPDKIILSLIYGITGLLVEGYFWLQWTIYYFLHQKGPNNSSDDVKGMTTTTTPDEIVFIIGHWRSGTTYLHYQLTDSNYTNVFTMRNSFTIAPQAALLLKPLLTKIKTAKQRPIDWVEWDINAPQEIDIGLQRFTPELPHVAICQGLDPGEALVKWANCTPSQNFKRQYQLLMDWGWIHDTMKPTEFLFGRSGDDETKVNDEGEKKEKYIYVIKTPMMTAHVGILVRLYPKAKFVYIERDADEVKTSFGRILKIYNVLFGCWMRTYLNEDDDEKDAAVLSVQALKKSYLNQKHLIPAKQLCEIKYEDLISDPDQTISKIQEDLDFQLVSSSPK